ncbi:MAG: hypothetical protein ABI600_08050 [Luteolibacter sp.]
MANTEMMIILANSEKKGNKCVAGKRLTINANNQYDRHEWIRPIHPQTDEGEIPTELTLLAGHSLAPLDVVSIDFDGSAENPDHPEDVNIKIGSPWKYHHQIEPQYLTYFCDQPITLWGAGQGGMERRVPEGFVRRMNPSFTLCLIQPQGHCRVDAFYEPGYQGASPKFRKRLHLNHNGSPHEFDITDTAFIGRHDLAEKARSGGFSMTLDNPAQTFLCLSLTPAFRGHHYKIAAAIFEP